MAIEWWPSPAKLNLFLHITGRNEQGYHLLQSVFQLVDLADQLAFEVNQTGNINLITPIEGVNNQDNLIVKAAQLLRPEKKANLGCDIRLKKCLPMGGGIGGGSSNAATTLVALNHLWQLGHSLDELAQLGLQLGADVPIFVQGNSAFAEGVGEVLTPMNLPSKTFLIVYPHCHISTAKVFASADLPRNTAKISIDDYHFEQTHNDCQEIVCKSHPKVAKILHHLLEYAPSRMTGTGACVFAVFDNLDHANEVLETLPDGCQGFVAKGVNRSPLHVFLQNKIAQQ